MDFFVTFLLYKCNLNVIFCTQSTGMYLFDIKAGRQKETMTINKIIATALLCAAFTTNAQAEVRDRQISASSSPALLFQQIVKTATAMCNEAAEQGEVFNITQCVDIVVGRTVAELDRPKLTEYALIARPAIATI